MLINWTRIAKTDAVLYFVGIYSGTDRILPVVYDNDRGRITKRCAGKCGDPDLFSQLSGRYIVKSRGMTQNLWTDI